MTQHPAYLPTPSREEAAHRILWVAIQTALTQIKRAVRYNDEASRADAERTLAVAEVRAARILARQESPR